MSRNYHSVIVLPKKTNTISIPVNLSIPDDNFIYNSCQLESEVITRCVCFYLKVIIRNDCSNERGATRVQSSLNPVHTNIPIKSFKILV